MRIAFSFGLLLATGLLAQEQMHLTVAPATAARPVMITANSIQRMGAYPSIIHLTGNVQIKSPVCLSARPDAKAVCDGYTIVKADTATYNEASGEIGAHGAVTVTPVAQQ